MTHIEARTLRNQKGFDATFVAQKIGVSRDDYLNFERGKINLPEEAMEKLERLLGYIDIFSYNYW